MSWQIYKLSKFHFALKGIYQKHRQKPFNIYSWLDSSTKNLRDILDFQQPKNINRGQAK